MFEPYRPRRLTAQEEKDERERNYERRQRQRDRKVAGYERQAARTSAFKIISDDISYRDHVFLAPVLRVSRSRLDQLAYDRRTLPTFGVGLPSLVSICAKIFIDAWATEGMLDGIQPQFAHYVRPMLNAVEESLDYEQDHQTKVPFKVWTTFSCDFPGEIPLRLRTFHGFTIEDDVKEFNILQELNTRCMEEWSVDERAEEVAREKAKRQGRPFLAPPIPIAGFFLAIVDLANLKSFDDAGIATLRTTVATFLTFLRLDGTSISDAGISSIARVVGGDEGYYGRLEMLSLRYLKGITDLTASKVAKLPSLRMLDIRGTTTSPAFRNILAERPTSPSRWRPALPRADYRIRPSLELDLFGPSYSPSHILTSLHHLGIHSNRSSSIPHASKSLCIEIKSIRRTPPPSALSDAHNAPSAAANPHVAYSSVYGNVYGSRSIVKRALIDDASAEPGMGGAFKGQDDAISAGYEVGSSMFAIGQRKFTKAKAEEEAMSDVSDEEEELEKRRERWQRAQDQKPEFYKGGEGPPEGRREPVPEVRSAQMLVRHLPVRHPCEGIPVVDEKPVVDTEPTRPVEGSQLKRKKFGGGDEDRISGLLGFKGGSDPSSPRTSSAASPASSSASSSFPASNRSSSISTPGPARKAHPGSALLTSRSKLAAFRTRPP